MKHGSTLQDVALRVQQQSRTSRDFLARPDHLRFVADDGLTLALDDGSGSIGFGITDTAHEQMADAAGIPMPYARRMRSEAPGLLAENLNIWLRRGQSRRLIRTNTSDGQPVARAFLSDRYRPLDNASLLEAMLPELAAAGAEVLSCELTERRIYVKAVTARFTGEVRVGETVQAGIVITNSEVGFGSLSVQPLIYTLRCTNGLVLEDLSLRQHHIGKRHGSEGDNLQHLISNETRVADDRAFFLRVRDVARAALSEANFRQNVERLRQAAMDVLPANQVERIVEVTAERFHLSDGDRSGILSHLIAGGDLTRWGLCSAITRHSQDVAGYDSASDLERVGGKIIEMSDWRSMVSLN